MNDDIEKLQEEVQGLREDLSEIKEELAKYKGFVGGCFWVISAMIAAVKLLWPWIQSIVGMKTGG